MKYLKFKNKKKYNKKNNNSRRRIIKFKQNKIMIKKKIHQILWINLKKKWKRNFKNNLEIQKIKNLIRNK